MSESNADPLDANLLVALEALLSTCSVTAAAERLGVTQSAMSHRLRQLREHLGDPLLVRGHRGMVLTERAQAMAGPLKQALSSLRNAVHAGAPFDPRTAERRFVVSTSDYGELVAVPALMAQIRKLAPGIVIDFEAPVPDLWDRLESGRLDLAIAPRLPAPTGIRCRKLFTEGFQVALRKGHPQARGKRLTLEQYLALHHLVVIPRGSGMNPVDQALAEQGLTRHVALRVQHFATAPFIAAQTDLVLTSHPGLLRVASGYVPLVLYPPPLALPEVPIFVYWHERVDTDPAHRWLRSLHDVMVRAVGGEVASHSGRL